jgi:chromosome segregation ATPase
MVKFYVVPASEFVPGRLLRPMQLNRRLVELKRQHMEKLAKLESLPREIDRLEADMRQTKRDLDAYEEWQQRTEDQS